MEQSDLHYAALMAAANGILIINRSGVIEWANPAVSRLTGYSMDELVGQTPRLFKSGAHSNEYYAEMWTTINRGQVWHGETINRRKDGNLYTEEQMITPVKGADGQITHYIAIKHDISRRKQAEAAIARSNQELLQLSQSERTQREFAEALFNATLTISSRLELDEMLIRILDQTLAVIPCQAALLLLLEDGQARIAHHYGVEHIAEFVPFIASPHPVNTFRIIRLLSESLKPLIVADSYADPGRQNIPGLEWVISYAAAPLLANDELIGVIVLMSDQMEYFPLDVAGPLRAFAIHCGLAIQQARSDRREIRARKLAETLSAASLALTQSLDLDYVLQTLLDLMEKLIPFDSAAILLANDETTLQVVALRGYERYANSGLSKGLILDGRTKRVYGDIIANHHGVIINDVRAFPDFDLDKEDIRSWMGVPLLTGTTLIGVLGLDNHEMNYFSKEQMQIAEALARQAAMAIQNAWLFE